MKVEEDGDQPHHCGESDQSVAGLVGSQMLVDGDPPGGGQTGQAETYAEDIRGIGGCLS